MALVTETYPPEVNGVALTLQRVVEGLRARHHDMQLIRPRQAAQRHGAVRSDRFEEVLMRGMPIPRYPTCKHGPAVEEGAVCAVERCTGPTSCTSPPKGRSAGRRCRRRARLKLPVCSDFRTNFHAYSRHYGVGWLQRPIMAYLRKFHNRTACTMVPTERAARSELAGARLRAPASS